MAHDLQTMLLPVYLDLLDRLLKLLPRSISAPALTALLETFSALFNTLTSLSLNPTATLTHAATTSPATWRAALAASRSAPASFELIKTLVYKPKTAKTAAPVPVVVIARDATETELGCHRQGAQPQGTASRVARSADGVFRAR
ncbi:hypothetical protein H0H81_006327 [Sphagnurus paluster]|uniref:Uncharacterized protein n=1 Tax=Sphagnurus paluster TaxID=117069 RepID=A0A9P7K160_9AGAR|nr:hypothetical protein H0H81_006327 [Sphagnurus paluster]